MKRVVGYFLIAAVIVCRVAIAQPSCEATLQTSGSALSGKTYTVQSELRGVTIKDALERLSAKLPSAEVEVTAVDSDRGRLVGKTTTPGQRQYPVEIRVASTPEGCHVTMSVTLPFGAFARGGMGASLCQMIDLAKSATESGLGSGKHSTETAPDSTSPAKASPDRKSGTGQPEPSSARHLPPENLQNNAIANRMLSTGSGAVFVLSQRTLFRMQRDAGDLWQRVAEDVKGAAIDANNDRVIYTITSNDTVQKSLDGGQRWLALSGGLPQVAKTMILINPSNSDEIFVGTEQGLYRTKDGGFGWEATGLKVPVNQFYLNPAAPSHAYALASSGVVMASVDSGSSWLKCDKGLPTELIRGTGRTAEKAPIKVTNLFFIPHGGTYLLAATAGKGLFRSDDHGASWRQVGASMGPNARFTSAYVGDGEVILAGTQIARSTDGNTWAPVAVKTFRMAPGAFEGVARHPKKEGLLVLFRFSQDSANVQRIGYVGKGGALVGLSYGVMPRSSISAAWGGFIGGRPALYAMVSNWTPTRYEGRYDAEAGTYVSLDGGYSWESLGGTDCGARLASRPGNSKDVWLFGGMSCMAKVTADGLGWEKARGPRFDAMNSTVNRIAFDPVDATLLYYAAGVNDHRVYRYKYDANGNGEAVDLKVGAADVVVCEGNPKALYAGVGQFSSDGGWTWNDKSGPLMQYVERNTAKTYRRHDFTLLSCRQTEIRIAVHRYDAFMHTGGFWIIGSSDLGDSWHVVASVPDQAMTGIFGDPNDVSHLFAVIERFAKTRRGTAGDVIEVIESKDWGATWKPVFAHKVAEEDKNHESETVVTVFEQTDNATRSLIVGGRVGLWKSDDGGKIWAQLGGVQ